MSIVIEIDGVDKTSSVIFNTLKIRNRINNRADECSFQVKKYAGRNYRPSLNDEVVITANSNKIFGGVIIKIDESAKKGEQVVYDIKCTDYAHYLRRKLVVERYEDTTLIDIVDDLITNYTSDGFTTNNVLLEKDITSISFNGLTVSECLDKLAKSLSAYWYVDYDKDIHFFRKTTELAPFNLTDTSANYIYESLQITEDITQLRNLVTVRGGVNPSTTDRTETKVCKDADEDVYPLGYKFASLPIVKINGVAQTVGVEYLDDDGAVECQWSYQQKYIRFTAGNLPSVNDVIEVIGKIEIPVIVEIGNDLSIAQYGVWEFQIKDDTIKSNTEAIDRAIAELQTYADELNEGSFSTYQYGLSSGQVLSINSTLRDKSIDVVIQEVETRIIDPLAGQIIYNVSFATLKTIGIIEFLQNSLIDEDIIEDAQETLLRFFQVADSIGFDMSETINIESIFALQYNWGVDDNQLVWNLGVWGFRYRYDDADSKWGFSKWE